MRRIAILMFGQPRFFKLTASFIRDEFKLQDTKVDFFGHFWSQTGFIPEIMNRTTTYQIQSFLQK